MTELSAWSCSEVLMHNLIVAVDFVTGDCVDSDLPPVLPIRRLDSDFPCQTQELLVHLLIYQPSRNSRQRDPTITQHLRLSRTDCTLKHFER